jgi:hypothetical protein
VYLCLTNPGKLNSAPGNCDESNEEGSGTTRPSEPAVDMSKSLKFESPEVQALWDLLAEWKQERMLKLDRVSALVASTTSPRPRFDWVKRKPPRVYFPEACVRSLDDTPKLFQQDQTKEVRLRSKIKRYLQRRGHSDPPHYTKGNIWDVIGSDDLAIFNAFDFMLNDNFTFSMERTSFQKAGPATSKEKWMLVDSVCHIALPIEGIAN